MLRGSLVAAALTLSFVASSARAACPRPTDPGGAYDYEYGSAVVQSYANEGVLVWYTTQGPHAVNPASTRSDGVPDDVTDVADVTHDALASYLSLGYRPPVSDAANPSCGSNGGDGRLDVYLVHMSGADGMTVAESDRCTTAGAASRCASFIFAQSNFAPTYTTADTGVHTVLPHEAFHTIQNAYDASIDRFWAEGTAQWAAKKLDPSLTDLERFLPAFFADPERSLDAPPDGVTSAFLYGAAIWPTFLTQRYGDDFVRAVLDQEGVAGGPAIGATDAMLATRSASMGSEYPRFASWLSATGSRADGHGFANAADYPSVTLTELTVEAPAHDVTSGLASFFYHAKASANLTVTLNSDASRNAGTLVPVVDNRARVDLSTSLPATLGGEAIVIVSGRTADKTDAPFALALAPLDVDAGVAVDAGDGAIESAPVDRDTASGSGCTFVPHASGERTIEFCAPLLGLIAIVRLRRPLSGAGDRSRWFRHRSPSGSTSSARAIAFGLRCTRSLLFPFVLSACSRSSANVTPGAADAAITPRIVSVGGSVTETVFALGAGDSVVGVDTSSLYPDAATTRPKVGYQRTLAVEGIVALRPTLVIASSEAGPPSAIEQLQGAGVRVEIVPADASVEGAKQRIVKVAQILARDPSATLATLDRDLARAADLAATTTKRPKVLALYARGQSTMFVFGQKTGADAMLRLAAADNAVTSFDGTKPLTSEAVVQAAPDAILLPSRGLESIGGIDELLKLPGVAQTPAGKAKRVVTMDDLLLLGFGPRTGQAAFELTTKLHPKDAPEAPR